MEVPLNKEVVVSTDAESLENGGSFKRVEQIGEARTNYPEANLNLEGLATGHRKTKSGRIGTPYLTLHGTH